MKIIKTFSVAVLMTAMTFLINSCSKSDDYQSPGGGGGGGLTDSVTIQGMQFQPSTITVTLGTKITWTNKDADVHTVTSDDGTSFNSGNISSQGSYSFTPTSTGTFAYHCTPHPQMHGILIVVYR